MKNEASVLCVEPANTTIPGKPGRQWRSAGSIECVPRWGMAAVLLIRVSPFPALQGSDRVWHTGVCEVEVARLQLRKEIMAPTTIKPDCV